jgi:hypothetical protein
MPASRGKQRPPPCCATWCLPDCSCLTCLPIVVVLQLATSCQGMVATCHMAPSLAWCRWVAMVTPATAQALGHMQGCSSNSSSSRQVASGPAAADLGPQASPSGRLQPQQQQQRRRSCNSSSSSSPAAWALAVAAVVLSGVAAAAWSSCKQALAACPCPTHGSGHQACCNPLPYCTW